MQPSFSRIIRVCLCSCSQTSSRRRNEPFTLVLGSVSVMSRIISTFWSRVPLLMWLVAQVAFISFDEAICTTCGSFLRLISSICCRYNSLALDPLRCLNDEFHSSMFCDTPAVICVLHRPVAVHLIRLLTYFNLCFLFLLPTVLANCIINLNC